MIDDDQMIVDQIIDEDNDKMMNDGVDDNQMIDDNHMIDDDQMMITIKRGWPGYDNEDNY